MVFRFLRISLNFSHRLYWWEWVPHRWHVENCRHRLAFCMLHYCPLCLVPLKKQDPQENHSLTPPCCNVEKVLNRSRKPKFTRKPKSDFSKSCGDLSANSVFPLYQSTTHGVWHVSNMFSGLLESRGAVTSRFEVPLGIFSLENTILTGGLTPPKC